MEVSNFEECLKIILKHEGGYVNHPSDPGGETNYGITKRVYEEWSGKPADSIDMRAIPMSDVASIYEKNYWNKCRCGDLPRGVDLCVFDFAVNAGPGRAAKFLQNIIGAVADGAIGPNTLKKVDEYIYTHSVNELINTYQKERQSYYERLKHFETFGRGWTRRVNETTELAHWRA